MEKFYTINGEYAEVILDKDIYPLVSVKKALSIFMNNVYIKIDTISEKNIVIKIELKKENKKNIDEIIGELYNELLRESLRYDITLQTKNIRELIVGRALYTACIDIDDDNANNSKNEENYEIDAIAVNWFDKYGNKEE